MEDLKMHSRTQRLLIWNPLPVALKHYVEALSAHLQKNNIAPEIRSRSVEQQSGTAKIWVALRILTSRIVPSRSPVLVVWPAFGFLEAATWSVQALFSKVYIIIHDVNPLIRAQGHGSAALLLFRLACLMPRIHIICHTSEAAEELRSTSRVIAMVVRHPMMMPQYPDDHVQSNRQTMVSVLGQYKPTRSISALTEISDEVGACDINLMIAGRGWPEVRGWTVDDSFISELEFGQFLKASACIVIPYDRFYQSGIAVRALEQCTAVVAPRHPHIEQLFGTDWPGFSDSGWAQALSCVIELDKVSIYIRAKSAYESVDQSWKHFCTEL
ncbi:hypothetical protein HQ308_22220 [Rhodococcus sp. BP-241]|uniref:hypothetical protein n=1 Tax=Rhodococcus sp. BP-241 TaxID=2739441 RepID=UPI001C9AB00E|nr:hypothetical protein [Rhodococcus sp. BP-241]MBY6709512.1 hypothetical protein [Rhodococcus sp. BP-241]